MNITINDPGNLEALPHKSVLDEHEPKYVVYMATPEDRRTVLFWITKETAAQWIDELAKVVNA